MDENGYIDSGWPSKRIPPGGMFHTHKVKYTPETQKMLKVIMDEAKLTLSLRKKMDWCLRTSSSLSDIQDEVRERCSVNTVNIRPRTSRRRSYLVIKTSGDLERERFKPTKRTEDREKIKKRLQDIMEFGRDTSEDKNIKKEIILKSDKPEKLPTNIDMLHELLTQIQEREEWLDEMEALGEGSKHREIIQAQIAERIRKIDALNILPDSQYSSDRSSNTYCSEYIKVNRKEHEIKKANRKTDKNSDSLEKDNISVLSKLKNDTIKTSTNKKSIKPDKQSPESNSLINEKAHTRKNKNKYSITQGNASNEENILNFSLEGTPCLSTERSINKSMASEKQHK